MTTTSISRGSAIASSITGKVPPATRPAKLGGKAVLEIEGKKRFSEADLDTLRPSLIAAELALLLGKSPDWLNDYRLAAFPRRFRLTDEQEATLARLKREERNPSAREDLAKAFRQRAREEHEIRLRECRMNAKAWINLVHHYARNRDWLQQFEPRIRARLCRQMADGVARASGNVLPAENRDEDRRRKRKRREDVRAAKRLHEVFGYRKFRRPIPVRPNGQIDFRAAANLDLLAQTARGERTGISIVASDQWSTTEELRIAKRLSDEMQSFWKRKKDRSI